MYSHPDSALLVAQVQAEYRRLYDSSEGDSAPIHPDDFDPPNGWFVVGYQGDVPVASGGWRRIRHDTDLGSDAAEIKRMYVVSDFRRQGLSRRVLAELESTASAAGVRILVLETGQAQPEAISLYRASGYTPVDPSGWSHYGCHAESVHLGKRLPPADEIA